MFLIYSFIFGSNIFADNFTGYLIWDKQFLDKVLLSSNLIYLPIISIFLPTGLNGIVPCDTKLISLLTSVVNKPVLIE